MFCRERACKPQIPTPWRDDGESPGKSYPLADTDIEERRYSRRRYGSSYGGKTSSCRDFLYKMIALVPTVSVAACAPRYFTLEE